VAFALGVSRAQGLARGIRSLPRLPSYSEIVERITVSRRHIKGRREGLSVLLHADATRALRAWLEELQARGPLRRDM
jgi:hypothetical protein